jgi:hypothetical protein
VVGTEGRLEDRKGAGIQPRGGFRVAALFVQYGEIVEARGYIRVPRTKLTLFDGERAFVQAPRFCRVALGCVQGRKIIEADGDLIMVRPLGSFEDRHSAA